MREGRARPVVLVRGALAVLVAGLLLSAHGTTRAVWSDTGTIPGTSIHTGKLDVRVDGQDAVTGYAPLDVPVLEPGTSVASIVTVGNAGNLPLDYTVDTSGTNADGRGLFAGLGVRVTADATVGSAPSGPTCPGVPVGGARTVAAGATQKFCVELLLPAGAPASLADAASDVTIAVHADIASSWTDDATVSGTHLATPALTAPTLSCGTGLLGSIQVGWTAVPGATGYRIHSGPLGATVETVGSGTLSKTFLGTQGVVSVEALFGSTTWSSPASGSLTYSALAGVLGTCS